MWPYNPVGFFVLDLCLNCASSGAATHCERLLWIHCGYSMVIAPCRGGAHTLTGHDRSYWTLKTWHWFGNTGTEDSLECYCHMDQLYHSVSSVQTNSQSLAADSVGSSNQGFVSASTRFPWTPCECRPTPEVQGCSFLLTTSTCGPATHMHPGWLWMWPKMKSQTPLKHKILCNFSWIQLSSSPSWILEMRPPCLHTNCDIAAKRFKNYWTIEQPSNWPPHPFREGPEALEKNVPGPLTHCCPKPQPHSYRRICFLLAEKWLIWSCSWNRGQDCHGPRCWACHHNNNMLLP